MVVLDVFSIENITSYLIWNCKSIRNFKIKCDDFLFLIKKCDCGKIKKQGPGFKKSVLLLSILIFLAKKTSVITNFLKKKQINKYSTS